MKFALNLLALWAVISLSSCQAQANENENSNATMAVDTSKLASATFGAGCFWCVEAVFEELKGVVDAEAGYSGGHIKNPGYREVCTGRTGHAEVARIYYDPSVITFEQLVTVFFHTHDPTTLNRQGADRGTQYRSAIFYHDAEQKEVAERVLQEIDASDLWSDPIVTEISPLENYYVAEEYHQQYYENNSSQPYCSVVIAPKLKKMRSEFKDWLKE